MKILLVSDTHCKDGGFEEAVRREAPFDYLIHCGDVEGREFFIEALADCPCTIVGGNNDFFSDLPSEQIIALEGKRIFVTHGHYFGVGMDLYGLIDEARAEGCEIALFGHTHKPTFKVQDGIAAINPGSLAYPRQKNGLPSYAVLLLEEGAELQVFFRYLEGA